MKQSKKPAGVDVKKSARILLAVVVFIITFFFVGFFITLIPGFRQGSPSSVGYALNGIGTLTSLIIAFLVSRTIVD